MSMSFKASPDGTYGEILVNGQVVTKLPVTGNAVIPNLVGTVSQSGGVPTGAVVERGSNANGEYVRFADGTQLCFRTSAFGTDGKFNWTFPAVFISGPSAFCMPLMNNGDMSDTSLAVGAESGSVTSVIFAKVTTGARSCRAFAIGHWF